MLEQFQDLIDVSKDKQLTISNMDLVQSESSY